MCHDMKMILNHIHIRHQHNMRGPLFWINKTTACLHRSSGMISTCHTRMALGSNRWNRQQKQSSHKMGFLVLLICTSHSKLQANCVLALFHRMRQRMWHFQTDIVLNFSEQLQELTNLRTKQSNFLWFVWFIYNYLLRPISLYLVFFLSFFFHYDFILSLSLAFTVAGLQE